MSYCKEVIDCQAGFFATARSQSLCRALWRMWVCLPNPCASPSEPVPSAQTFAYAFYACGAVALIAPTSLETVHLIATVISKVDTPPLSPLEVVPNFQSSDDVALLEQKIREAVPSLAFTRSNTSIICSSFVISVGIAAVIAAILVNLPGAPPPRALAEGLACGSAKRSPILESVSAFVLHRPSLANGDSAGGPGDGYVVSGSCLEDAVVFLRVLRRAAQRSAGSSTHPQHRVAVARTATSSSPGPSPKHASGLDVGAHPPVEPFGRTEGARLAHYRGAAASAVMASAATTDPTAALLASLLFDGAVGTASLVVDAVGVMVAPTIALAAAGSADGAAAVQAGMAFLPHQLSGCAARGGGCVTHACSPHRATPDGRCGEAMWERSRGGEGSGDSFRYFHGDGSPSPLTGGVDTPTPSAYACGRVWDLKGCSDRSSGRPLRSCASPHSASQLCGGDCERRTSGPRESPLVPSPGARSRVSGSLCPTFASARTPHPVGGYASPRGCAVVLAGSPADGVIQSHRAPLIGSLVKDAAAIEAIAAAQKAAVEVANATATASLRGGSAPQRRPYEGAPPEGTACKSRRQDSGRASGRWSAVTMRPIVWSIDDPPHLQSRTSPPPDGAPAAGDVDGPRQGPLVSGGVSAVRSPDVGGPRKQRQCMVLSLASQPPRLACNQTRDGPRQGGQTAGGSGVLQHPGGGGGEVDDVPDLGRESPCHPVVGTEGAEDLFDGANQSGSPPSPRGDGGAKSVAEGPPGAPRDAVTSMNSREAHPVGGSTYTHVLQSHHNALSVPLATSTGRGSHPGSHATAPGCATALTGGAPLTFASAALTGPTAFTMCSSSSTVCSLGGSGVCGIQRVQSRPVVSTDAAPSSDAGHSRAGHRLGMSAPAGTAAPALDSSAQRRGAFEVFQSHKSGLDSAKSGVGTLGEGGGVLDAVVSGTRKAQHTAPPVLRSADKCVGDASVAACSAAAVPLGEVSVVGGKGVASLGGGVDGVVPQVAQAPSRAASTVRGRAVERSS